MREDLSGRPRLRPPYATLRRHRAQSSRTSRSRADHDWTPLRTPFEPPADVPLIGLPLISRRVLDPTSDLQTSAGPRRNLTPGRYDFSIDPPPRKTPPPPTVVGHRLTPLSYGEPSAPRRAHELRRRPPTDASRAGRSRAARHRPSHATSRLTPTRSTSRFSRPPQGEGFPLRPTTPSAPVSFLLPGCRGSRRSRLASCHPPPGLLCSRRTRDKLRVSPGGER